jgi:hypothetical protein
MSFSVAPFWSACLQVGNKSLPARSGMPASEPPIFNLEILSKFFASEELQKELAAEIKRLKAEQKHAG